jgi:tRNA (adenine22-N1)-methyltransferase
MALKGRLQFIFEQLLAHQPVWDFCCDHGYLGIEALRSGNFPEVHFVDQVPQIIENLENLISTKFANIQKYAHLKISAGENIGQRVQGNVVIAGVGAMTIFEILRGLCVNKNLCAARIILCPQRDEKKFLKIISDIGLEFSSHYEFKRQFVCQEKNRSRYVFIFESKIK